MKHHTKDKGDMGVGFVLADLMSHGIRVAIPLSEHLPFDCIAILDDLHMKRISIKYRAADNGAVVLRRKSYWADKHGLHTVSHKRNTYDAFGVYCPDTKQCYYVRDEEITNDLFSIRVRPPERKQVKKIHFGEDYTNPMRIYAELV